MSPPRSSFVRSRSRRGYCSRWPIRPSSDRGAGRRRADPAAPSTPDLRAQIAVPRSFESFDPAVAELIRARVEPLSADPSSAELHADLGLVYEANQLWDLARQSFERAYELSPEDPRWRYHPAVATWETADPNEVIRLLTDFPKHHPDAAAERQRLGLALMETGELEAAREIFERLAELAPQRAESRVGLGESLLRQRRFDEAVAVLEKAVHLDGRYRAAHYQLGLAYRGAGRLEEAQRELRLGVDATVRYIPGSLTSQVTEYAASLSLRLEKAGARLRAGDLERAVEIIEGCLDQYPDNVTVLNDLAVVYLRMGRLDAARELLEDARAVNDLRFSTYINLSSCALRSQLPLEALSFADAAVERGDRVAATHAGRARVLHRLGRRPEAAASLARAVTLDPDDSDMLLALAGLRQHLGELEAALELYRQATTRWPRTLSAQLGRARAAHLLGHSGEALQALSEARIIAPEHPAVIELGRLLRDQPLFPG